MPQINLEQPDTLLKSPSTSSSLHDQALELLSGRPPGLLNSNGHFAARNPTAEVNSISPAQQDFADKLEQFAAKNFGGMDDNKDKYLSRAEVKLYALRTDLSAEDKAMANFIVNNYEDLNRLTDAPSTSLRWNQLNPKGHAELTMNDFTMLRVASDATQRQKAVQQKQGEDCLYDYFHGTTFGALGGTLFTAGFAKMLGPRAGGALVLIGAVGGGLAGCGITSYVRNNHYSPGCQNYYDQKRDLSKKILDRIGK